tara:strand:- start:2706 stop:2888 length:183 start_codon:yes stop_codon:yes gene_type:complete
MKEVRTRDFELTNLLWSAFCELCDISLPAGSIARPFAIGGGFMYWCKSCDANNHPIEEEE